MLSLTKRSIFPAKFKANASCTSSFATWSRSSDTRPRSWTPWSSRQSKSLVAASQSTNENFNVRCRTLWRFDRWIVTRINIHVRFWQCDFAMIWQINCDKDQFTCAILTVRCRTLTKRWQRLKGWIVTKKYGVLLTRTVRCCVGWTKCGNLHVCRFSCCRHGARFYCLNLWLAIFQRSESLVNLSPG